MRVNTAFAQYRIAVALRRYENQTAAKDINGATAGRRQDPND